MKKVIKNRLILMLVVFIALVWQSSFSYAESKFKRSTKPIADIFSEGDEVFFDKRVGGEVKIGFVHNNWDKVELGEEFYKRWLKPGLPYPREIPPEERLKLPPKEVVRRLICGMG